MLISKLLLYQKDQLNLTQTYEQYLSLYTAIIGNKARNWVEKKKKTFKN